ncbi:MAG: transcriptional regulator [Actinomycetia bacterium]|nr:transcriptional regulator [Actinomycetes bacterium]
MAKSGWQGPSEQLRQEFTSALIQLAEQLQCLRDATPLTLQKLSRATNVSVSALSRYFTGQALPPLETVEMIGQLCGGDLTQLRELWEAAAAGRRRLRAVTHMPIGEIPAGPVPAAGDEDKPALAGQLWRPIHLPDNPFRRRPVRYSALAMTVAALMTLTGITVHALTVTNEAAGGETPSAAAALPTAGPLPGAPAAGASPAPRSSAPATAPGPAVPVPPAGTSATGNPPPSLLPPGPSPAPAATAGPLPAPRPKPVPPGPAGPADPGPPTATGETVSLVSTTDPVTPFVVDVDNWSTVSGTPLHLWSWREDVENDIRTQIWEPEVFTAQPNQPARQRLRDLYNGLCLARGDLSNGGPVIQSVCDRSPAQQWYSDASGRLRSAADGRCLDIRDGMTQGSALQVWDCRSPRRQGWKFTARTHW